MKRIATMSSAALAIVCLALGAHWYRIHERKISPPVSRQPAPDTSDVCTVTTIKCSPEPDGREVPETKGKTPSADPERLLPARQGKLWGYKDNSGRIVITPQFEKAYAFSNGLARVRSHKYYGYIDTIGKVVISFRYANALDFAEGRAAVFVCKEGGCFNEQKPLESDHDVMGLWGYIDTTGKLAIPGRYSKVESFSEGLAAVTLPFSEGNYIDKTGRVVIITSPYHGSFHQGLAKIGYRGHQQYIDKTGKPVVPPMRMKNTSSPPVTLPTQSHDKAACTAVLLKCPPADLNDWPPRDLHGDMIFPPDYPTRFAPDSEGLLPVTPRHRFGWGYRDSSGRFVIPPQYFSAENFKEHLAIVELSVPDHGLLLGYIDRLGKVVIPPKFRHAHSFSEGLAAVEMGHGNRQRWGFIDTSGKIVIPARFRDVDDFSENLARVRFRDKDGYIDRTGRFVISPRFEGAGSFSNGRARIWSHFRIGYIDKTARTVVPPQYREAFDFSEGRAAVLICPKKGCTYAKEAVTPESNGRWGYIDTFGKLIIPAQYLKVESFTEGLAAVKTEHFEGHYINKAGEVVIITSFDHESFFHGLAIVGGSDYKSFIDKTGKPVIPPMQNLQSW